MNEWGSAWEKCMLALIKLSVYTVHHSLVLSSLRLVRVAMLVIDHPCKSLGNRCITVLFLQYSFNL